ncbi:polymer-forming cytoskeletal protein [Brevibacillus choshinensis]|uniref:polymer-forming cytoskeletal protein n=1 Tax=Brevibacillus choshinensis TaxID=54911 RepID=UPI002E20B0E5|nr:polymer-forming cytoskeletal protein [Brevibacillus choshinensis]
MKQENRPDLIIHGSVNASGGVYNEVSVHGFGKIQGNVECADLYCAGHATISGDVQATFAKVEGNASISGKVGMETMEIYGQADVNGDVDVSKLRVDGSAKVHGSLASEEVKLRGFLKVTGDCEAEEFKADGVFSIGGLLNAGHIEILLHGNCGVREIGGERIEVRKSGSGKLNKLLKHIFNNTLSVDSIEGDEIYLEYTRAKVVRGNSVEIGPGCEIDLVEYTGDFRKDISSQVKEHKQC